MMSIDKLKKQSKNLLQLLPDFLRDHAGQQGAELRLSDCQEFVARLHGYPNWHAASTRLTTETQADQSDPDAPVVTQENGKTTVRIPGTDLVMETPGVDEKTKAATLKHALQIQNQNRRRDTAHEEGIPALKRLFEIAQGNSGQCRHVAAFLLSLYNGARFPFDLTDLRSVDTAIFDDCVRVLKMDAAPRQEVHTYFKNGGSRFEELARRFQIPDVGRLKSICEDIQKRGVGSFGGEDKLDAQIQHALASTWPADED